MFVICLQEKTKEIEKKRAIVMDDLGKVEPAVKEAQNGECSWQYSVWTVADVVLLAINMCH